MAWIESHQELRDHPKTRRLARQLNISLAEAIGHLHMLWWWALEYALDGDLAGFEAVDIANAAGWDGDPLMLVKALTEAGGSQRDGFLHVSGELHDWGDYTQHFLSALSSSSRRIGGLASAEARRVKYGSAIPLNASNRTLSAPAEQTAEQASEQTPNNSEQNAEQNPNTPKRPNLTQPNLTSSSRTTTLAVESNREVVYVGPAVDAILGVLPVKRDDTSAIRQFQRIVDRYPLVDHELEAGACLDWMTKKRRQVKSWAATYGNWAKNASDRYTSASTGQQRGVRETGPRAVVHRQDGLPAIYAAEYDGNPCADGDWNAVRLEGYRRAAIRCLGARLDDTTALRYRLMEHDGLEWRFEIPSAALPSGASYFQGGMLAGLIGETLKDGPREAHRLTFVNSTVTDATIPKESTWPEK